MTDQERVIAAFASMESGSKQPKDTIIRAPFGYPGGKSRSVAWITPLIPKRKVFVDVFGGSGIVLLNNQQSDIEVFNDINSGIVAAYRCCRDEALFSRLMEWLDCTVHSREEFIFCRDNWQNASDPVERAGRWLYMNQYSFGRMGRNYGYAKTNGALSGQLVNKIPTWGIVRGRFKSVNVENMDWRNLIKKYDSKDAVFYLDPPYFDTDTRACYGNGFTRHDHDDLLEAIQSLKGCAVLSGYANTLNDSQEWDARHTNKCYTSIGPTEDRHTSEEVLWIKN